MKRILSAKLEIFLLLGGWLILSAFTYNLTQLPPKTKDKLEKMEKSRVLRHEKKMNLRQKKILFLNKSKARYQKIESNLKKLTGNLLLRPKRKYSEFINTYNEVMERVAQLLKENPAFERNRK